MFHVGSCRAYFLLGECLITVAPACPRGAANPDTGPPQLNMELGQQQGERRDAAIASKHRCSSRQTRRPLN
ncbi:hypothetical protein V8C35DRAFT_311785 [Trichoderma chlorosporum]